MVGGLREGVRGWGCCGLVEGWYLLSRGRGEIVGGWKGGRMVGRVGGRVSVWVVEWVGV